MAARATLALKPGVWFRRGRLLIVSPDSLGTACPLSGRNSTYRLVQILEAGSKIVDDDIVVTGVWPAEAGPQPPTRWVLHFNGKSQLSEDERHILCDIAQDRARIGPAETDRTVVMSVCRGHKHATTDYSN